MIGAIYVSYRSREMGPELKQKKSDDRTIQHGQKHSCY